MYLKKDLYADEELVFKSPFGPRGQQQQQHQRRRLEEVHVKKILQLSYSQNVNKYSFLLFRSNCLAKQQKKNDS